MNIKKLNEKIDTLLEKEISPEFRQTLDKYRDTEREKYKQDLERLKKYANPGSSDKYLIDRYSKLVGKKNLTIDNVYKILANWDIDVQNCTIETLDGGNLKSKDLKKLYDSAIEKDPNNQVMLMVPESKGFACYNLYKHDTGKFSIYHFGGQPQFGTVDGDAPHIFKINLNNGDYAGTNLFFVYGPNIEPLKRERRFRKSNAINLERERDIPLYNDSMEDAFKYTDSYIDKSGYVVNFKDIMRKLADYKKQKGSYNQELDKLMTRYSTAVKEAKKYLVDFDPKIIFNTKPKEIIEQLAHLGYIMHDIDDSLDEKGDASRLMNYIQDAHRQIDKLNELVQS